LVTDEFRSAGGVACAAGRLAVPDGDEAVGPLEKSAVDGLVRLWATVRMLVGALQPGPASGWRSQ
jgi:hypothetical protein